MPQTRQVGADPGLGLADRAYEFADGALLLFEELQDVQPCRISQNSEKARGGGSVGWQWNPGIHIWKAGYHVHRPTASIGFQTQEDIDDDT
jgi:hypothetical protein